METIVKRVHLSDTRETMGTDAIQKVLDDMRRDGYVYLNSYPTHWYHYLYFMYAPDAMIDGF